MGFLPSSVIFMVVLLLMIFSTPYNVNAQNRDSIETGLLNRPSPDSTHALEAIKLSRDIHKLRPDEEKEYSFAQEAVNIALELKDTLLYARALDNMGLLYRYHQQYLQSLSLHIKAYELVQELSVPAIYKMIFANNAGVAARYGEKYDLSVSYYLKALEIAEKEKNLKNIAISSNGLGNTLGHIPNRSKEALNYFNRALKSEEKQGNMRGKAMNLLSIGHYFIDQKQFSEAREHLSQLMALNRQLKDEHGIANGFELLEQMADRRFDVIFTTAYSHYAMQAFKAKAVNYLLKPIDQQELKEVVDEWIETRDPSTKVSNQKIDDLLDYLKKEGILKNKIALPVADGIEFIDVNNIMYCKSQSNYTTFHLSDGNRLLLSKTLSDVENLLSSYFFIRTHRSFLINPNYMKKYFHSEGGFLLMQDDESIPVSNQHKKTIRGIFDAMGEGG